MKKNRRTYTIFQKSTSIFLMLTLLWLTISTPFVMASQQELTRQQKSLTVDPPTSNNDDDSTDSSNNNVEEKGPNSNNNFSEELLDEHHTIHYFFAECTPCYKLEESAAYTAFHGELLVPPPNAA